MAIYIGTASRLRILPLKATITTSFELKDWAGCPGIRPAKAYVQRSGPSSRRGLRESKDYEFARYFARVVRSWP